jgi:cysteine desulfurase family protein
MATYLDNSATSFPKPECVYETMDSYMRFNGASAGRGNYTRAREAEELVYRTRKSLARLLDAKKPGNIVFTSNVTDSLNMILKGYLKEGDTVLTSDIEHNAMWRPLHLLQKERGIHIRTFHCAPDGTVDLQEIRERLSKGVSLVATIHGSNVIGNILPIAQIAQLAHEKEIPVLVDAAQTAGAYPLSIRESGVDFLAFTGHKGLLGPMGTGGFYLREGIRLETLREGGTGTISKSLDQPENPPDRYETGTMNMGGIAGLHAAAGFLTETGVDAVQRHESFLIRQLMEELSRMELVELYGPALGQERLGLLSFNIKGVDPYKVSAWLDEQSGIMVRAGLHCSPQAHRVLGTVETGAIRASVGYFNTSDDISQLAEGIKAYVS